PYHYADCDGDGCRPDTDVEVSDATVYYLLPDVDARRLGPERMGPVGEWIEVGASLIEACVAPRRYWVEEEPVDCEHPEERDHRKSGEPGLVSSEPPPCYRPLTRATLMMMGLVMPRELDLLLLQEIFTRGSSRA